MLISTLAVAGITARPSGAALGGEPENYNFPDAGAKPNDYALLALTNQTRQEHALNPMRWNEGLATASRFHAWDMLTHNCYGHPNCDGREDWGLRLVHFQGGDWKLMAENVGGGQGPADLHDGLVHHEPHFKNIVLKGVTEFGGAMTTSIADGFGNYKGVEDFIQPYTKVVVKDVVPTIPGVAVIQPANWMDPNHWTLKSNFYDPAGKAPAEIFAVVNSGSGASTKVPLTLLSTTKKAGNGTYAATIETPPNYEPFCEKVYFQARRADGTVARFPETGSIGFGSNLEDLLGNHANCYNTSQGAIPAPPGDGDTNHAPVVTISSPSANAVVSGVVKITASATDDVKVKKMELYIDGKRAMTRNLATVSKSWTVRASSVRPGPHTIEVRAYDVPGLMDRKTITVTK